MVLALRENPEVEWDADITFMADMTVEEHNLYKTGFNETHFENHETLQSSGGLKTAFNIPEHYDGWRQKSLLSPVSEQLKGSCWAHSAAAVLGAQLAVIKGEFQKLAAQELFDCGLPEGMHAEGGNVIKAWEYVVKSGRVGLEQYIPEWGGETKRGHACFWYEFQINALEGTRLTKIYKLAPVEDALRYTVSHVSPVSVSMETTVSHLRRYTGGKKPFEPTECGPIADQRDGGRWVHDRTLDYKEQLGRRLG